MIRAAIIKNATGEILRIVSCPEGELAAQVGTGEIFAYAPAYVLDSTHFWDGVSFASKPTPVQPARTLIQAQSEKWEEMKRERTAREFGTFTWNGSTFDIDPLSQSRLQGAMQIATIAASQGQAFAIEWTLADNTTRWLTGADIASLGIALGTYVSSLHQTARTLRQTISNTTTVEAVDAIRWP